MADLPLRCHGRPPGGGAPAPTTAIGRSGSPSGRMASFRGDYRLERLETSSRKLLATGVFTGTLTDSDGSGIGVGSRRTRVEVDVVDTGRALLVLIGPLDVDLLGLPVVVQGLAVDVLDTPCEAMARAVLSAPPVVSPVRGQGHVPIARQERSELLYEQRLLVDLMARLRACPDLPGPPLQRAMQNQRRACFAPDASATARD